MNRPPAEDKESASVYVRFHGELNDFLPWGDKQDALIPYKGRRTVKDLIESLGVPHVEVGRIQSQGRDLSFAYIVRDRDQIDVYPGFFIALPPRFLVDDNVAKLSPLLRMLGFDTAWAQGIPDPEIAALSRREKRTVLSRDRGLLKRKELHSGLYIRSTRPHEQVQEVLTRFKLKEFCSPFTRCLNCNHFLQSLSEDEVARSLQIPAGVKEWTSAFYACSFCHKVFWNGSHHKNMELLIQQILHS